MKPTGVSTNAPWIQDVLCDMPTRPHRHVTLKGLVRDVRPGHVRNSQVWYTSLAAEYLEGMCNKLATDFEAARRDHFGQASPARRPTTPSQT